MTLRPAETELQRRWAVAPPAWLTTVDGDRLRVLFAGTWNHGPGPDFADAILVDPSATAPRGVLRGAVEVHRTPQDWHRHGHDADPAYGGVIVQLLGDLAGLGDSPRAGNRPPGVLWPGASLPGGDGRAITGGGPRPPPLPCDGITSHVGREQLDRRMRGVARGRLWRKLRRYRALLGAAEGDWDESAYQLFLRELGRGGNGVAMATAARKRPYRTLPDTADPLVLRAALEATLDAAGIVVSEARAAPRLKPAGATRDGPRRPANRLRPRLAAAATLLARWRSEGGPAAALAALADRPEREALAALQVPGILGRARARQLLVDVSYVIALAARPGEQAALTEAWMGLGGGRYHRSEPLRRRLLASGVNHWRNGETQALLELERCYCRQGACAICPLVAGRFESHGRRMSVVPSPNAD